MTHTHIHTHTHKPSRKAPHAKSPCKISEQVNYKVSSLEFALSLNKHQSHSAPRGARFDRIPQKEALYLHFHRHSLYHFRDMLKKDEASKRLPNIIIFKVGLNDKSSDPLKTSCRDLMTMLTWIRARFLAIKIYSTKLIIPLCFHNQNIKT